MRLALAGLCLAACTGPAPVRVAGVTVDLITPADVDPLIGAELLLIRVLDAGGQEIARASGSPDSGVPFPLVEAFGLVEVEVTARAASGVVLAVGRTGLITVDPGDEHAIETLFLPVNEAIPLTWTPSSHRVGHAAVLADDGRVLLMGGRPPSSSSIRADSEWWDLRTGYDGAGPTLPNAVANARVVELADGSLLVVGGDGTSGPSRQVVSIGADRQGVSELPALTSGDADPCVVAHPSLGGLIFGPNGVQVYTAAGRVGGDRDFADGVEGCAAVGGRIVTAGDARTGWGVLDLEGATWPVRFLDRWTGLPDVPSLLGPMLVPLDDGTVWVGGGYGFSANPVTRIVDLDAGTADRVADLGDVRVYGYAAPWRDGNIVLGGGYADEVRSQEVRSLEIHDPHAGSLMRIQVPVRGPTMTVLPGGTVLFTGGLDDELQPAGAWAVAPWVEGG